MEGEGVGGKKKDKYRRRVSRKQEGCKDRGMETGERSKRGGAIDTCCFKLQALTRMLCAGGAQCSNHSTYLCFLSPPGDTGCNSDWPYAPGGKVHEKTAWWWLLYTTDKPNQRTALSQMKSCNGYVEVKSQHLRWSRTTAMFWNKRLLQAVQVGRLTDNILRCTHSLTCAYMYIYYCASNTGSKVTIRFSQQSFCCALIGITSFASTLKPFRLNHVTIDAIAVPSVWT